ncbi:MAG: hypothetical protein ABFD16_09550 [Thermoguttaceae bacterium]
MSDHRHGPLKSQVQAQLRSVLREADFTAFDLDRAFGIVVEIAKALR